MILFWLILDVFLFLSLVYSIKKWTKVGACCAASSTIASQLKSWSDLTSCNCCTELILAEHNSFTSFLINWPTAEMTCLRVLILHTLNCNWYTTSTSKTFPKLLTRWSEGNSLGFFVSNCDLCYEEYSTWHCAHVSYAIMIVGSCYPGPYNITVSYLNSRSVECGECNTRRFEMDCSSAVGARILSALQPGWGIFWNIIFLQRHLRHLFYDSLYLIQ